MSFLPMSSSTESITPLQRLTTHGAGPPRVTGARPGPSQPRSAFLDLQNWAQLQFSRSTTSQTLVASTKVSKNIPKICMLVTLTDLLKGVNERTAFIRQIHVPKTQEDFTVNLTEKSVYPIVVETGNTAEYSPPLLAMSLHSLKSFLQPTWGRPV